MNNIKDPKVVAWLLPAYLTTTGADLVTAVVMVMLMLHAYFSYRCHLRWGLTSVTLIGVREDCVKLCSKTDNLLDFDLKAGHMVEGHALLAPIAYQIIVYLDGKPNLDFWDEVCSCHGGSRGLSYLSGQITAFSDFSAKGRWRGSTARPYPMIETTDISVGVVLVLFHIDNNGMPYDTDISAGQFDFDTVKVSTGVQPHTDW